MANMRPILLILLVFLGYSLWIQWQSDYNPEVEPIETPTVASIPVGADIPVASPAAISNQQLAQPVNGAADLPAVPLGTSSNAMQQNEPSIQAANPTVTVTTDVLRIEIDLVGGTLTNSWLLKYPVVQKNPEKKVQILSSLSNELFIAQSGLLGGNFSAPTHNDRFEASQREYALREGQDELRVPLTWQSADGIKVTKTFIFKRGDYDIEVRQYLSNNSNSVWQGNNYQQLQRAQLPDGGSSFTDPGSYSFLGAAVYTPEEKLEKLKFSNFSDDPIKLQSDQGWIAMIQHYFFSAWIPQPGQQISYSTAVVDPNGWPRYLIRAVAPAVSVPAGGQHEFIDQFYVGPKLQEKLDEVAPGLSLTVDYGIFTIMSKPLFWLLSLFHSLVANWGFAIILLTLTVKLAFFKLTEAQYKSMARMRKLQPRIEQMKARYGDDRQRLSQETMKLYKKEKVNPLGGCLPMLIQIPVFIALYWVLLESVELRQAPFMLWITNLSDKDPYFILPVLNGIFMVLTQRLSPTPGMDPMQKKIMQAMPIAFSVLFAFFPAGLVLYWATNAGLSLLQQWYITRKIAATE